MNTGLSDVVKYSKESRKTVNAKLLVEQQVMSNLVSLISGVKDVDRLRDAHGSVSLSLVTLVILVWMFHPK